jgi:hypothetical protein
MFFNIKMKKCRFKLQKLPGISLSDLKKNLKEFILAAAAAGGEVRKLA